MLGAKKVKVYCLKWNTLSGAETGVVAARPCFRGLRRSSFNNRSMYGLATYRVDTPTGHETDGRVDSQAGARQPAKRRMDAIDLPRRHANDWS